MSKGIYTSQGKDIEEGKSIVRRNRLGDTKSHVAEGKVRVQGAGILAPGFGAGVKSQLFWLPGAGSGPNIRSAR